MEGYRLFGYSSPPDTIALGTQREYYDKETNTMQTLQFTGEDIHTHGEGDNKLVGWKPFGHARVIKEDSPSLSKTYNSKGQEVMITFAPIRGVLVSLSVTVPLMFCVICA